MDGTANNNFNSIDKEINEFISKNSKLIYKTESKKFGERHKEGGKEKKNTLDGKFTKHLASSGMFKYNGLNTLKDKEKYIEGSKDWMLKLV